MILDSKLNFESHLEAKIVKANPGLDIMIQLKNWVSHRVLKVLYKLYIRPHQDYGDVIYHYENTNSILAFESKYYLMIKVEEVRYGAAKIVTGA